MVKEFLLSPAFHDKLKSGSEYWMLPKHLKP
jgi:hypothetical protein